MHAPIGQNVFNMKEDLAIIYILSNINVFSMYIIVSLTSVAVLATVSHITHTNTVPGQ